MRAPRLGKPGAWVYNRSMDICEIIAIKDKDSFRWKWRHVGADGDVEESDKTYPLFYECLSAAREKGYKPSFKRERS